MQYFHIERILHGKPGVPVITSTQCRCKGGGLTVEEGPHVIYALLVGFYPDNREGLVWKLCDNLVIRECHIIDRKVSDYKALGCAI